MSKPVDDPYHVLSVPRNATASQIKSAYRKLALKYHPDRQSTPDEKERCSKVFVKIGNAYEILADRERRAEYDRFGTIGSASGKSQSNHHGKFGGFGSFDDFFANDPFFNGKGRSRHAGFAFTDPFELFREAFGDMHGRFSQDEETDFMDPFSGGMGSMMNHMMQNMRSNGGGGGGSSMNSFSSFSSSTSTGVGGARESISTRTEIVNGKQRTITERTLQRPDGSIERHVETSDGQGFLEDERGYTSNSCNDVNKQLQQSNLRKWGGW